jgi:hypothetical protein
MTVVRLQQFSPAGDFFNEHCGKSNRQGRPAEQKLNHSVTLAPPRMWPTLDFWVVVQFDRPDFISKLSNIRQLRLAAIAGVHRSVL